MTEPSSDKRPRLRWALAVLHTLAASVILVAIVVSLRRDPVEAPLLLLALCLFLVANSVNAYHAIRRAIPVSR